MTAVADIWAALSTSPDRTLRDVALDQQSAAIAQAAAEFHIEDEGMHFADEVAFEDEAARWAVEALADAKLSKVARDAVNDALTTFSRYA